MGAGREGEVWWQTWHSTHTHTFFLRIHDEKEGSTVLDRAARIRCLVLHEDVAACFLTEGLQPNQRRLSNRTNKPRPHKVFPNLQAPKQSHSRTQKVSAVEFGATTGPLCFLSRNNHIITLSEEAEEEEENAVGEAVCMDRTLWCKSCACFALCDTRANITRREATPTTPPAIMVIGKNNQQERRLKGEAVRKVNEPRASEWSRVITNDDQNEGVNGSPGCVDFPFWDS